MVKEIKENKNKDINKHFHICETYSANMITDWVQRIRNMFGFKLDSYNRIVNNGINECMGKLTRPTKWYKIDVEELGNGFVILIYGEYK